jgi:hypothetical protein
MDVERTVPARLQQRGRQQQPVGGDDERIRAQRLHPLNGIFAFEVFGLEHFNAALGGKTFHGAGTRTQPSPGRPVRLRQREDDLVAGGEKALERPFGELGGAGEDEAQESAVRPSCAAAWPAWRECAAA